MALTLKDMQVGTIVDRVSEWGDDGKERSLEVRRRGVIVKVDGDVPGQSITGLWVAFGSDGVPIKVNGKKVNAVKVRAAELARFMPADTPQARIAWRRLFGEPVTVGAEFAAKKNASRRVRVKDELALTPKAKDAVVTDENDEGVEGMELPPAEA